MSRYRKRPVEVEAMQWTGGNYEWLNTFAGNNWGRADAHDVRWDHDDTEQVIVWNSLERLWIPVPVGHWVIRGVQGELYPCEPAVFAATYEAVGGSDTPADQPEPELQERVEYGHQTVELGWVPEHRGIKYASHQRTVYWRADPPLLIDHWSDPQPAPADQPERCEHGKAGRHSTWGPNHYGMVVEHVCPGPVADAREAE